MTFKFSNIVDIKAVQSLMDDFWKDSGISTAIVDIDGTILVATGWQEICTQFHRKLPKTNSFCLKSDTYLAKCLNESPLPECGYIEYECQNGMMEISIPIIVEGRHLANIFLGQFFYEPPEEEYYQQQAQRFGFDVEAYLAALKKVPILSPQKVKEVLKINKSLIVLLTSMGIEKLRQMEAQRDLLKSEERARESERRLSTLMANLPGMAYRCQNDRNWTMEIVSAGSLALTGYSVTDLLENRKISFNEIIHPEDREMVWQMVQNVFPTKSFTREYRIITASGETRWVWEQGQGIFAESGSLLALEGFIIDITDRKQAEAGVQAAYQQLENIIEFLPDATFVIDNDKKLVAWNKAIEKMTGVSKREISSLGQYAYALPFYGTRRPILINLINSPVKEIEELYDFVKRKGDSLVFETYVPSMYGGKGAHLWGIAAPLLDQEGNIVGAIESIRDISELKKVENDLKKTLATAKNARDRITAIFKCVGDGLIFTDIDGRIFSLNHAAEKLLGIRLREVFQHPLTEVIHHKTPKNYFAAVCAGDENVSVIEWERLDDNMPRGRILQAKSSMVCSKDGVKTGLITILRDVTRERELDQLKNEFISTAAHELRSPLTSVMGYTELLRSQQGFDDEQRSEFLAIIYEKSEVLSNIIDDLLDLSRVESGQLIQVEKACCDITATIRHSIKGFKHIYPGRRLTLDLPEGPTLVCLDENKFGQVMENLLSNAVKFSPTESLVAVALEETADTVNISVRDQGLGMTQQQVNRIFDTFYRVDASNTAKGGLGIGLSIVKKIVDAHKGEILVNSQLGRGTDMTVVLPKKPG